MRPIKFRAWDKKKSDWIYLLENTRYFLNMTSGNVFDDKWSEYLGADAEQFIGLEDRNGTEIYEGDIVLMDEEAKVYPGKKLVIEYSFGIPMARPVDSRFYVGDAHELCVDHLGNHKPKHGVAGMVIGNIHENPELLV